MYVMAHKVCAGEFFFPATTLFFFITLPDVNINKTESSPTLKSLYVDPV